MTLFVPAEMVAVLPPSEPAPLGRRLMPVAPLTFVTLPFASVERTVTLNAVPTAAVAVVRLAGPWREVTQNGGTLVAFRTPKG